MAIKVIAYDPSITRQHENGSSYDRTDFIADAATDVTAMNANGSAYLKYPAGSMVYCAADGKKYILKADQSAYVEVTT